MPDTKCEGCGIYGPNVNLTRIRLTNGVLSLCDTCLDDVNRKSPLLAAAEKRVADLEAGVRKINDSLWEWERFWWWQIMKNWQEAMSVHEAIQKWILMTETLLVKKELKS